MPDSPTAEPADAPIAKDPVAVPAVRKHPWWRFGRGYGRDDASTPWDPATPKLELRVSNESRKSNADILAIISQIGALVVAALAVAATWLTADHHDRQESDRQKVTFAQENERAQAAFRQSQQKDAYAGFANAATDISSALEARTWVIIGQYPYFHSDLVEGNSDISASLKDLSHALNLVVIYGGLKTTKAAHDVYDAGAADYNEIANWNLGHPAGSPMPTCREVLSFVKDTMIENEPALKNATDNFNNAAREELRIEPLPPSPPLKYPPIADDVCESFPP